MARYKIKRLLAYNEYGVDCDGTTEGAWEDYYSIIGKQSTHWTLKQAIRAKRRLTQMDKERKNKS